MKLYIARRKILIIMKNSAIKVCCLLSLALISLPFSVFGQETTEEEAIIKVIKQMFDGMRAGDSSMISQTFVPDARMGTAAANKDGVITLRAGSLDRFLTQMGTPHDKVYDEKIWSYDVRIDGPLAYTWTEYTFYLGDQRLHCGFNVFEMVKFEAGWKITSIVDTRRNTDCKTPEVAEEK